MSGPERDVAVSVREATRTHGTVQVLAATSAEIAAGEALVVWGPNGSGKTTLLRLVAGTDLPTSGSVHVLGSPAFDARRTRREDIAVLLDGLSSYPDLTVAEHLALVASAWGRRHVLGTRPAPSVDDALDAAGLTRVRDQYPGELSSGESQMFALACTLYRPGALVVLDEPEQRLDAAWRQRCRALLLAALDAGRTLVVSTHDRLLRAALVEDRTDGTRRGVQIELAAPAR
ncbi:ATP-binding cassette domain-containing protein [Xylanimonas allomyrinae]|uniref:ATP-binding cassette domain-containing protein n=1 Tax=Xylanimonas allomyrinae TaxID=2509459 RepID=A0A4P6EQG5_9MICO|nr:ATP-binding cassette domain-containing protein [Xylanimonas allomyrinae]QAY62527.1 ATP-binding cassette domain-containing protein [Xylanimonas allomyrinae]